MLISVCIPCHRRHDDLMVSIPKAVAAANASPPVELLVVDYANVVPVEPLLTPFRLELEKPNTLTVVRYRGRTHYHNAHARNLSVRTARGRYIVISSADLWPELGFFPLVRKLISETGAFWLHPNGSGPDKAMPGVIVLKRSEFIKAGGYDERMEFYGGEDKELNSRLVRRNVPRASFPVTTVMGMLPTGNGRKVAHYRVPMSKMDMLRHNNQIRYDNDQAKLLVANEGRKWGEL
jgi:hypothetical protein